MTDTTLYQIRHKESGQYIKGVRERLTQEGNRHYVFANTFNSRKTFVTLGKAIGYVEEFAPAAEVVAVRMRRGEREEGPSCYVIGRADMSRVVQSYTKNTKDPGLSTVRVTSLLEKARFFDSQKEARKALDTVKEIYTILGSYYQTREQEIGAELENPYLNPMRRKVLGQNLSGAVTAGKINSESHALLKRYYEIRRIEYTEEALSLKTRPLKNEEPSEFIKHSEGVRDRRRGLLDALAER